MNFSRSIAHRLRVTTATFVNPSHHGCFLLILLLLCPIAAAAQGTPPSWVQAFGSTGNGANLAQSIKAAPDQNLYVTGRFSSTATFGSTTVTSAGGTDIFLAKYSPSGSLLWIAQAGGTQDDLGGYGIDLDQDGNVYVTGSFQGPATFHSANSTGTKITVASGGQEGIFLAKYTSSGTLLWVQTGTSDCPASGCPNFGTGIAVNSAAGTVYISEATQADITFSSADGTNHVISGSGAWHMGLAKYDTNGNFQWGETNSANPNSLGFGGVAVDAEDNAYTAGWLENQTTFSSADGHDITIVGFSPGQSDSNYPCDAYLAKYDKNGNVKWVNHIGGYKAVPGAVTVGPSGEITLVGLVGNINYGSPGEAQTIVTSQPPGADINLGGGIFTNPFNIDEVVATYNPAGVALRAMRRGGPGNESATGVAYDSRGNLYVAAMAQGNSQPQVFVDEYSGKNLLWEATANAGIWNGVNTVITPALSVDDAGSVFVTNGYAGTASFGDIKLSGTGATEVFVAKLNTAFANQSADLLLRLYASPTPVHQGDLLTFTFPVWNRGPNVAYLEELKTQVPAGTVFDYIRISGTPGLGTCTTPPYQGTGQIVCHENGAMALNTTWTVRLTVKVTAPAGTIITENAATMASTPDPNLANNTATVSLTVVP
jgi:Domain of unknown function DUF11/Beta-propeller repeat